MPDDDDDADGGDVCGGDAFTARGGAGRGGMKRASAWALMYESKWHARVTAELRDGEMAFGDTAPASSSVTRSCALEGAPVRGGCAVGVTHA